MSNSEITPDKQSATPIIPCMLFDNPYMYATGRSGLDCTLANGNNIYFITSSNAGGLISITIGNKTISHTMNSYNPDLQAYLRAIRVYYSAGKWTINTFFYSGDTYPYAYVDKKEMTEDYIGTATVTSSNGYVRYITYAPKNERTFAYTNLFTMDALPHIDANVGNQPALTTASFNDFDRSSTLINSIIKLPYPIDTSKIGGFIGGYNVLRLKDNVELDRQLNDPLAFNHLTSKNLSSHLDPNGKPHVELESKFLSSEFRQRNYVYGDNKWILNYELVSGTVSSTSSLTIQ